MDIYRGKDHLKATYIVDAINTNPTNGPVLFCSLASVVVVCNSAGGRATGCVGGRSAAAERVGGRAADTNCRNSSRSWNSSPHDVISSSPTLDVFHNRL